MKNTPQILNLLLAVALIILVAKSSFSGGGSSEAATEPATMDAVEAIMTRSSVRSYTSQTIEKDKVETMLRAGMAAPTGGNRQPWRFVVIDQREILDQIPSIIKAAGMAAKAPLAIVACGVPSEGMGGNLSQYWIQDTSAATENILLAAHAMGLGAVWCGVYPDSKGRLGKIQQLLDLPEGVIPLNVICVGYPDSEPHVKDKWKPERVSYNKYNGN